MNNPFHQAKKEAAKIRVAFAGPSGSGKTFSALAVATGISDKIALIDTEKESASLYADIFKFDTLCIEPPFTPQKYIDAIKAAEVAGYRVLVIDSLTHAWAMEGGILEIRDHKTAQGGNSFEAWRKVTPMHNALVNAILQAALHIIVTLRVKQDYVVEKDDRTGKMKPRKIGLAPVQREGLEYEFTTFFDISPEHYVSASKDRTNLFDGQTFIPSIDTGKKLMSWLNCNIATKTPVDEGGTQADGLKKAVLKAKETTPDAFMTIWSNTSDAVKGLLKRLGMKRDQFAQLHKDCEGVEDDIIACLEKLIASNEKLSTNIAKDFDKYSCTVCGGKTPTFCPSGLCLACEKLTPKQRGELPSKHIEATDKFKEDAALKAAADAIDKADNKDEGDFRADEVMS